MAGGGSGVGVGAIGLGLELGEGLAWAVAWGLGAQPESKHAAARTAASRILRTAYEPGLTGS
jgi:hypothetical protein